MYIVTTVELRNGFARPCVIRSWRNFARPRGNLAELRNPSPRDFEVPMQQQGMYMNPVMGQPAFTMAQPVGPVMGQPPPPQWQQPYYGQQPYGAPPPQIVIQAPAPIVVNQQPRLFAVEPPPGAPPGGVYQEENYIGVSTLLCCLLLLFFFWPATCAPFCCPCDQRVVYIYAGAKYTRSGQMVPAGPECCGSPCGGPAM